MPVSTSSATNVVWDLKDLYAGVDDPQIDRDLQSMQELCTAFAEKNRSLFGTAASPPVDALAAALVEYERICELMSKLGAYVGLITAADTANPAHRRLEDRVRQSLVERENQLTFFDLGWLELNDAVAAEIAADPRLANYAHHLTSARRYKPHTRSEPEELLLNQKSLTARAAWINLFDEFVAALEFKLDYGGEQRTLNQSQILSMSYESDRGLRLAAQKCFFSEIARHELVLSTVFNAVAQDHHLNDQIRGYKSPLSSRHLANEVAPEVVERMLAVTETNYSIAHQYYALKARLLKLPKMATYDQYAPVAANMPSCDYNKGKETVLAAFGRFHPTMQEVASDFFEKNWIDAEVRPGKRGGAFSASTVPAVHPYILLNWTDKLRDVSTLAHELGHGIHQYLSRKQTYLNFHHPLTIAETASVFAEFLTFDYVMETTAEPDIRLGLLCGKIEDAFATVFRQNVLTRFEQAAHSGRRQEKLSSDELCNHWWQANEALYGDAVEMLEQYRWGWAYIPHFIHTPFYCYAYVFGELMVLSLYRMYQEEGAAFVPRYLELLSSGSSAPPEVLLRRVGADISDPAFWQKGLNVLKDMVQKAQTLADQLQR